MQDYLLLLVPMYKNEIASSFNISYDTLRRKIKHLDLPPSRVVPKDILRICECCGMCVERVIKYINENDLRR